MKRSYQTAFQTVSAFSSLAEINPDHLYDNDLTLHEVRQLVEELHIVYFARLFAAFEASLRHYWRNGIRDTKPLTEILISSIARRHGVPQDTLDEVQAIRDFRNSIAHDDHEPTRQFTIDEAIGHLNTFIARLPLQW